MKKLFVINLIFTLCLLFIFNTPSFASNNVHDASLAIKNYFTADVSSQKSLDIEGMTGGIYSLLKTIGMILALCIITTISISYMVGNPKKRAELKERLIYYVIGVVLLTSGVIFLDLYANLAEDVKDEIYQPGSSGYENPETGNLGGTNITNPANLGGKNLNSNVTVDIR